MTKIKRLHCSCCGNGTAGRQWHNRDTGFGLCRNCIDFCHRNETDEEFKSCYGERGVHYDVSEWLVYSEYATTSEAMVAEFDTMKKACDHAKGRDDLTVMRRLPDFTLTSEF